MHDSLDKKDYFKFPWLNGSQNKLFEIMGYEKELLEKLSLSKAVQLLFLNYPDLKDRIIIFFDNISNNIEEITTPTDDETNLAMYPIVQIMIQLVGNRVLGNGMRNIYAKHCYNEFDLKRKNPRYGLGSRYYRYIKSICDNLSIHIEIDERNQIENRSVPFMMDFMSYLTVSSEIKEIEWKLINRFFNNGFVYLEVGTVERLIREFVRIKVSPNYVKLPDPIQDSLRSITEIKDIEEFINKMIAEKQKRFQSSLIADDEVITHELFAPCINYILYKLNHGENLTHNERLAIAFYYLNTNHSIESTVDLFRTSPDFDEEIARYQVEFAAGKRGKGIKYGMYGCPKLKSLHLCQSEHAQFGDELCQKGFVKKDGTVYPMKNPAGDYVFWKKVKLKWMHDSQVKLGEKILQKENGED